MSSSMDNWNLKTESSQASSQDVLCGGQAGNVQLSLHTDLNSSVGNPVRLPTAAAIAALNAMSIKKKEIIRVLHDEPEFAGKFINYMLERNLKTEADLVDQLFNSSEKRLARALLILARYGKAGEPETIVAKISQETLAELVGTTRSRVNFFMNKFRKLGFIHYNGGGMQIHSSLLNVVLHD